MQGKIELLAPAGSFEALEAAVNAGADAIYLGGNAFGARAYANNFDNEEMRKAVRFAHLHGVQIFVTVNTLVDDSEFAALADYLLFLDSIKIDGIIVQDMGVINVAKKLVPHLPLHASTQMTITNLEGVRFAAAQGMTRAVLARELSLEDIKKICAASPIEIEVFIHGALCVCYSGQCLMSSLIGGRSGNRGRCAQPCRLPYTLVNQENKDLLSGEDAGKYLLSPRDLNTLSILPQLIEAGVTSFKIEGRMKRPEYVAIVVDAYRRAIDSYLAGDYKVPAQDFANIEQVFNRDFTTAYLLDHPGKNMMSDRRPNNRGVLIGRVVKLDHEMGKALVKLDKDLHLQDGLEFWVSVGGRVGTTVTNMEVDGQEVERAAAGSRVLIDVPRGVRLNDRIFRTLDSVLMEYAGKFYGENNKKHLPVSALVTARLGSPMEIKVTDSEGHCGVGKTKFIVEIARKHALDEAAVRKQLQRMGTTEYELTELTLQVDEGVMVPMSEMNEARREACENLDQARLVAFERQETGAGASFRIIPEEKAHHGKKAELTVWVDTPAKVEAAIAGGADWIIYGGDIFTGKDVTYTGFTKALALARQAERKIAFSTPRIIRDNQLAYFKKFLQQVEQDKPDLLYLNNNSLFTMVKDAKMQTPIWADMSLNNYNFPCLDFWSRCGAKGATLSIELNMKQIEHLVQVAPLDLECLVQGPIEMMVSEYCVSGSFLGHLDKGACSFQCQKPVYLLDRTEARFKVVGDQFCRMHILNSHDLSVLTSAKHLQECGIKKLRIDGRSYDAATIKKLVVDYKAVLNGEMEVTENMPSTTRGHYYRGVL
jgi:putative protease